MSALAVADLHVRLGGTLVLRGVSFAAEAPQLVGLVGPNGAGKSTLLRALAGLQVPDAGGIALGGTPLARLSAAERARAIAYLPQARLAHWPLTAGEVVMLGRHPHRSAFAAPSAADRAAVARAMEEMGVAAFADRAMDTLSGGEACRVQIARTLAQEAPLLLADEPAAALDPAHQIAVMSALQGIARQGRLVLVTLHDLALAARWCDRVLVLDGGALVADGAPGEVLDDGLLRRVYGVVAAQIEEDGRRVPVPVRLV